MPPKPIPKSLKKSILTTLVNSKGMGALTPTQICERVNDDPAVPQNQKKKPKQMAHLMKSLARSIEGVETIVLSSNGTSRHGNQRFRVGYEAPEMTLAEAEEAAGVIQKPKTNLKQITVNLPDECVEVIKAWRTKGVSAGRYVEQLIRADVEANGVPESDD
jgi:hypothetical protein